MGIQLVTPPAVEPVSLAEMKEHLRVDAVDQDLTIKSLISAARQYAEFLLDSAQSRAVRWRVKFRRRSGGE